MCFPEAMGKMAAVQDCQQLATGKTHFGFAGAEHTG
jgi:hypothetical protein